MSNVGSTGRPVERWVRGHRTLTWALAWGLTGSGLFIADIWSQPRRGPLWVGLLCGVVAWGLAGGTTFRFRQIRVGLVVWAGAYGLAFWLGGLWGDWFERNQVGPISSAGFVGMLFGWAAGAGAGAFATAALSYGVRSLGRAVMFAVVWGLAFLVAGYFGLVAGILLGEVSKAVIGSLNASFALTLGWGAGAALGGLLASATGFAVLRELFRHDISTAV